jgi:hypothetical protein
VSRYDTVTGDPIELTERIGMLDRKMRIVNENALTERDWMKWAQRAFQSIYGFEFQGDSLLIARENLLASYSDYFEAKLKREPEEKELLKIASIISWNLWQMDGITYTIPYQEAFEPNMQISFAELAGEKQEALCVIKDWRARKIITFQDLLNKEDK